MNGLSLKTVIPGRNKIPGIYSSNFDPTAHSTMPMLTRLAIGALVIQTATLDPQCVESCTLALWIKTCPADCDDSTWQSINIGPVVIPPDIHCVSGTLIGNILHLVLTDGSTIDVDLSPLANTPVVADGVTITGNGTVGNPLVAVQPSDIGFRYTFSGLQSLPAPSIFTIVNYSVMVYNDGFTVNTGAGWNAVIPKTGYYIISAAAITQAAGNNPGGVWAPVGGSNVLQLELWVNGVRDAHLDYNELDYTWPVAATSQRVGLSGSIVRKFNAGDTFNIRAYNGTGTPSNLDGYGFHDYVSCALIK